MKRALMMAGALLLVSAPLHAYVSSGNLVGPQDLSSQVESTSPSTTSSDAVVTEPTETDPTLGTIDVRPGRRVDNCEQPGHPVPEPGTMAITSLGLLAAAAFRRKKKAES